MTSPAPIRYSRFADFYPFYLTEHQNRVCRRLHFVGSSAFLVCVALALVTKSAWPLAAGIILAYGCAWIGHFAFEKNRPASFKQPLFSLMGDWVMYRDIWLGRIPF
ncbi:MAG: Mpo1-like protein [Burkholderiaceae bacterium]